MKRPYELPEADCERLVRTEMMSLRWCIAALNSVTYANEDLSKRLECIPNGKARWRMMMGQLKSLIDDMLGTVPIKQCKTIQNTMHDMEIRLCPKGTPMGDKVVITIKDMSYLIDAAKKDACTACIYTDDEFRKCELYKILESLAPLDDYGDGLWCPYMEARCTGK